MKKTYTEEQKNVVLARLFAGEPIASISEDTSIAKSTLYAWSKSGKKEEKQGVKYDGLPNSKTAFSDQKIGFQQKQRCIFL